MGNKTWEGNEIDNFIYINSYNKKKVAIQSFRNDIPELSKKEFSIKAEYLNETLSKELFGAFEAISIHQLSYFSSIGGEMISNVSIYTNFNSEVYFVSATICNVPDKSELESILSSINRTKLMQVVSSDLCIKNETNHITMNKDVFLSILINAILYCYQKKIKLPVNFIALHKGDVIIQDNINEYTFERIAYLADVTFVSVLETKKDLTKKWLLVEIINNASFVSLYSDRLYINGRWEVNEDQFYMPTEFSLKKFISNIYVNQDEFVYDLTHEEGNC